MRQAAQNFSANLTNNWTRTAFQSEHSERIITAFLLLVLLLHVLVFYFLRQPPEPQLQESQAKPFKLEVSMLPSPETPDSKAVKTPELKKTETQETKEKPEPKKEQANDKPKTEKPVDKKEQKKTEQKPDEAKQGETYAALEKVLNSAERKQVARVVKTSPDSRAMSAVASTMLHSRPKTPNAIDNFPESDEHNPSPEYPDEAVFLGYQGAAIVKINISAKGISEGVELLRSSGHKLLDDSATKTLRKWRFTPTKQPDSVVIVVNYVMRISPN
jgi:protein TonB